MPDVVRLRYLGEVSAMVAVLGRQIEPDAILDFGGTVLEDNDDHYLIEIVTPPAFGVAPRRDTRAWPKSRWRNETAVKKPGKE